MARMCGFADIWPPREEKTHAEHGILGTLHVEVQIDRQDEALEIGEKSPRAQCVNMSHLLRKTIV